MSRGDGRYVWKRTPSWTELVVAFAALIGAFVFQGLAEQGSNWWAVPAVICLLVALAAIAD